ncbi:MAG: hypothetical protein U9O86_09250 [Campylobacterota bacterium]|nr:hypothetical protein [Campylobacterota bacterium]
MRYLLLSLALVLSLNAIEHNSKLSLNFAQYSVYENEFYLQGETELKQESELVNTTLTLEYLYSSEYEERRYLLLNELYLTREHGDYSFLFGKSIKYWGEMEGYNIADIYNQKNYLLDPFDISKKIGSIGFDIKRYFDEESLEFGVKLYEQDLDYPTHTTPFSPFSFNYDSNLHLSDKQYTPSFYLAYNFVSESDIDSESKILLFHGYDTKRYFIPINQTTLAQYAYRVNKLLFLSHLIYGETIFKCEASYTDVINDTKMSDYRQLSFGLERSFYDVAGVDISGYLEYYNYSYTQDNKIKNVDISELYDNDIFMAFRVDFTDIRASELKAGVFYDLANDERLFKLNAKSRIMDGLVVEAEFLKITTAKESVITYLGDSSRATLGLTYTF